MLVRPFSTHTSSAVYTSRNNATLVKGGQDFFSLLEQLIANAQYTIHLQTYIFINDETGQRIASAMKAAAKRGVKVYLLLDGYGSQQITDKWTYELKTSGIHFRWFSSLLHTRHYYFGRRLHHKVFVADAQFALVGGINITNRYNDMPNDPAWLDWALYFEGQAAADLFVVCVDVWTRSSWGNTRKEIFTKQLSGQLPESNCLLRVRRNDWVRGMNQVTRSYLEMFSKATESITIMSSYFLPGQTFRKAMRKAVKRGVKITVIAAGKSDVITAKHAERYLYRWLLKNNISIYEYQPHILHGKLSTYDGKWVTVGSYNVNDLSTFASIELNIDVLDNSFAGIVEKELQHIISKDCVLVTSERFETHNTFIKRVWQKTCYIFIRAIFLLFTFYFKQNK